MFKSRNLAKVVAKECVGRIKLLTQYQTNNSLLPFTIRNYICKLVLDSTQSCILFSKVSNHWIQKSQNLLVVHTLLVSFGSAKQNSLKWIFREWQIPQGKLKAALQPKIRKHQDCVEEGTELDTYMSALARFEARILNITM